MGLQPILSQMMGRGEFKSLKSLLIYSDYGLYFYMTLGAATLLSNYPLQASIFFTAINRPLESAVISVVRTMIIIPPLVFILIIFIGAGGIALGFALADILIISGIIAYMKRTDLSELKVFD